MSKMVDIRSVHTKGSNHGISFYIDDNEEVVGCDYEGNDWWVYVARYRMTPVPDTVHIGGLTTDTRTNTVEV